MNASLIKSKPGFRSVLRYLRSSAGQLWVAARGSVPLTSAYEYDPNDARICALPGTGLTVEACFTDGSTRNITEEARYSIVDSRIARLSDHGTIVGVRAGSTMLDIGYRGFKTRVTVHVVERSAEAYNNAIALLTAQSGRQYQSRSGEKSICRQFVDDVLRFMDLSLPGKASASDFYKWINRKEARSTGWYEVKDRREAQRLADLGHPVLAVSQDAITILNPLNAVNTNKSVPAASALWARCQSIAGLLNGRASETMQCFVHV